MRIDCESCGAAYTIDDALIGDRGIRAQCPKCGTQRVVKKDAAPAPSAAAANPFAPSPPSTAPTASSNPFATGPSPAHANPFAAKPTGAPDPFAGLSAHPFAPGGAPSAPAPGANPFASNPFATGAAAAPSPLAPAAPNPFGAPPSGAPAFGAPPPAAATANPFATAPSAAPNPFASAPAAANPFAAAPTSAPNPFAAAPTSAPNPFAGGPPSSAANPFASAPAAANPFASAAPSAPANPFGGAPPSASGNPFATAPSSNPFAGGAPANPFAGPPSTSPFGAPQPAPNAPAPTFAAPGSASMKAPFGDAVDPFGGASPARASTPSADPFESIDARAKDADLTSESLDFGRPPTAPAAFGYGANAADDDPFSDIAEAPKIGRDPNLPSTTRWQVEARGGSSEVTLDEVREMIRAGQVGPNDMAGPVGKPLQRIADSAILAVSLPKTAQASTVRVAAGVRSSGGGGAGRLLIGLVVVAAVVGGAYIVVTSRPDLLESRGSDGTNPFRRALPQWSMQFPEVQGTSQEHVVEGRKFMRQDTVVGYRRADEHFRRALLVDVSNKDAVAAYVENYANLPNVSARSDPEGVALAFEGLDFVLVQEPQNALLNRAYGALKLALGEVDEAQRYLSHATRVAPDDAEAKLLLARAQLDRDTQESLRLIELVQRQDPGLKAALVVAGAAHRRLGSFARARTFIQSRLESDPGNVPALRELARLEAALGRASTAVTALRKLLENDESDVDARLMIAKLLSQSLGKTADAERELSTLIENYSTNAGELILPAYAHFAYLRALRGDFDAAIAAAEKALALDANYAPAMLVVGRAKASKGDLPGARETLEGAVRSLAASRTESFYEPLARTLLADVQVRLGDTTNAIRNYNHVIDYDPRNARAFFGAAAAYMISDQPRQAVTVMRRALDVDPAIGGDLRTLTDYPTPTTDLLVYADAFKAARPGTAGASIKDAGEGVIRLAAGQDAAAEALFRKALAADAENHSALFSMGYMHLTRERANEALTTLRRASKGTGATHTLTAYYLARAELATGKVADAAKRLIDVTDSDKALFQATYWLAQAHLKQGKREHALDMFRAILKENPEYMPVKRTLADLDVD